VVAFDNGGRYVYANSAAERMAAVRDLVGRPVGDLVAERQGSRAQMYRAAFERAAGAVLLADDSRWAVDGNKAAREFLDISRADLLTTRLDEFAVPEAGHQIERLWALLLERGSLRGLMPLQLRNGLRRTARFDAVANVAPHRHMITFRRHEGSERPTELTIEEGNGQPRLTGRERQVLTLLARGANARLIAEEAVLSPETVRTHARNARKKLGATSRSHAVALAIILGEIDP
jgi:DNA-binding CsgD family transcriptional regulator